MPLRGVVYTHPDEPAETSLLNATYTVDPDAPLGFLDFLHEELTGLGWISEVYLNGHVYLLESPSLFTCQMRVWHKGSGDASYPNSYAFQFLGNYVGAGVGQVHHISSSGHEFGANFDYRVWANQCQIFIARPGVRQARAEYGTTFAYKPYSMCGGILHPLDRIAPFVACQLQSGPAAEETGELWWSAGDDDGKGGVFDEDFGQESYGTVESFRSGHICRRYSFCHNGSVTAVEFASTELQSLQLCILRPGGYGGDRSPQGWDNGFRFLVDARPVQVEPFLALGGTIYGQLYDALLLSAPYELEATERIEETKAIKDAAGDLTKSRYTNWVNHTKNYTNRYVLGPQLDDGRLYALMLLTGGPYELEEFINVAY